MRFILLYAFLSFCSAVSAQDHDVQYEDSLKDIISSSIDDQQILRAYDNLSFFYSDNFTDSTIKYSDLGIAFSKKIGDTIYQAGFHLILGNVQYAKGMTENALENYILSESLYRSKGEELSASSGLSNIGLIYDELENVEKAIEYYSKGLEIAERYEEYSTMCVLYYNLGFVYLDNDDVEESLKYNDLLIFTQNNYRDSLYLLLDPFIMRAGIYKELGIRDSARYFAIKSLEFLEAEEENEYYKAEGLNQLGELYNDIEEYELAKTLLNQALEISGEDQYRSLDLLIYKNLSVSEEKLGNYQLALGFFNKSISLKDSLAEANNMKQMNELHEKYDSEVKERKLQKLKAEGAVNDAILLGVSIAGILLLLLGVVMFFGMREKRKANLLLTKQKDEIEKHQFKMLQSINYAQRIQQSLLLSEAELSEILPSSFIFDKAKDIVSGDFYWINQNDDEIIVAVIDCTGHGVPGAFMSLITNSQLNRIVRENNILDPGKILNELHLGIVRALKQEKGSNSAQDGVDMSLIQINKKTGLVKYAGAKNPIIRISNEGLESHSTDPFSIGGTYIKGDKVFEQNFVTASLQCEKGDHLFIFSDGYVDQFGGDRQKKLNYSKFYEILENTAKQTSPTSKQAYLISQFEKWKGESPQLDDVLVFGIEML